MRVVLMCQVDVDDDPLEAEVEMPVWPQKGMHLRLCSDVGTEIAIVDEVLVEAWDGGRVEALVRFFTAATREDIIDAMDGARRGVTL